MPGNEQPTGKTKHGSLTLDQLANLQPGWGGLMPQISDRWWICFYAAQGGNWKLADYAFRKVTGLLKKGTITRPKYVGMIDAYNQDFLRPLSEAIVARDFSVFDRAFKAATDEANRLHGATGHSEIIWVLPDTPPKHLKLTP